jgi:hypothetical protein
MKKSLFVLVALLTPSLAFADVSIRLQVEAPTGSLYDQTLSVAPCPVTTDLATTTVSGKCALEQAGLSPEWSSFGDDLFLSTAGGATQDYGANLYWNWWNDLTYGQSALNKHELIDGEPLLIALGVMPLTIEADTLAPEVGATTTVTVSEFAFDSFFNPVWVLAEGAAVYASTTTYLTDASGVVEIVPASADPFEVYAEKATFVKSRVLTIAPVASSAPVTPPDDTATSTESTSVTSGGGSGSSHSSFNVSRALSYLTSRQESDGSFGSPLINDWAALAYASAGSKNAALCSYLRTTASALSSVTDYERHAMALLACGINPYSGTTVDYIAPILAAFDGAQIGDIYLDNDDIFALFPLLAAGYDTDDLIIQKTTAFIVSAQNSSGAWDSSIDMTAAAVQALSLVESLTGVSEALAKAKEYLHSAQQSDGGFGNSFSTSWALQAIAALGESNSEWSPSGQSGKDYLATLQENDGGLEPVGTSDEMRAWVTAYAIPAVEGDVWADLLESFPKPAGALVVAPLSATSSTTPALATSTVAVATTTPAVVVAAATTTTPIHLYRILPNPNPHKLPVLIEPKEPSATSSLAAILSSQSAAAVEAPSTGVLRGIWDSIVTFFIHLL